MIKKSFHSLRFSLTRETDTKRTKAEQFAKLQFLNDKIDLNTNLTDGYLQLPSL